MPRASASASWPLPARSSTAWSAFAARGPAATTASPRPPIAAWIEEGGLERHLRRGRQAYRARRDAAFAAIEGAREGGCNVACDLPEGGLALWTRWGSLDTWSLLQRARERGVLFVPEAAVRVNKRGGMHGARLSFSRLPPDDLRAAIAILAHEARALSR